MLLKPLNNLTFFNPLHPLARGLVGLWPMWEGAGSKLRDYASTRNHGELLNGAKYGGSQQGFGLDFDGTDDTVDIPDSDIYSGKQFTWSAWVVWNSLAANTGTWLFKGTFSSSWAYAFQLIDGTGGVRLFITNSVSESGGNHGSSTFSVSAKTLHHVVVVFDGNGAANADRLKFFVDGVEESLSFVGTIHTEILNSANPLRLGEFAGLGRFLDGKMSDLRIYNRVLSPEEIKQLFFDPYGIYI